MKTKKIVADTMPLALKMVRQQLGENAIIVNTRAIKTGGFLGFFTKQKFEVTAYSIENEVARPEPKYTLERKEMPETGELNQSGFHRKPQELYNYYSQTQQVTEKPVPTTTQSVENGRPHSPLMPSVENGRLHSSSTSSLENGRMHSPSMPSVENERPVAYSPQSRENENPVLDELQNMKKMMMNFMMNEQQGNVLPAGLTKWVNRLKKQGVDEEVVEHIVSSVLKKYENLNELTDDVIETEIGSIIKDIIEKRIPESNIVNEKIRMINVIGPTGVGKTTTIAKLATEQVLRQKRRVGMITTDVYRIGAVEQLKTYSGILNVPLEVVRTKDELDGALNKLAHCDLIYMDTTGRNYKEVQYRESINEFLNHPLESDNYLVLSLTTKFEDMQILLNEFLNSPVQKLILTKFDETSSFGSILNIAFKYPFQLAFITNGQSVPEDITSVNATQLVSDLLGKEK